MIPLYLSSGFWTEFVPIVLAGILGHMSGRWWRRRQDRRRDW
jgi:hypothetical protein